MQAPTPSATPLVLITGFLGSGKTTFINRLLQLPTPPKLGVVVNEFGETDSQPAPFIVTTLG